MRYFLYALTIFVAYAGDDGSNESQEDNKEESGDKELSNRQISLSFVSSSSSSSCDYYRDCWSCLGNSNCLWDPNTLTGSCKPATQCDFTYQARSLATGPPATACVRVRSQCGIRDFNGAPLDLNPRRGLGCTNHGQCGSNQYCFSCSKCVGYCGACSLPYPVSGMCGPAYRCPIDGDSISGTCPGGGVVSNPRPSCNYGSCSSCTAAYGCVWSGTRCYYSTSSCTGKNCANTPSECRVSSTPRCNYSRCSSCTAAYGCVWSGSYCYYSTRSCTGYGCANTPSQCNLRG